MFILWTLEFSAHMNGFLMSNKVTFIRKLIITLWTLELDEHEHRSVLSATFVTYMTDKWTVR